MKAAITGTKFVFIYKLIIKNLGYRTGVNLVNRGILEGASGYEILNGELNRERNLLGPDSILTVKILFPFNYASFCQSFFKRP
jgi:hypothetical protein